MPFRNKPAAGRTRILARSCNPRLRRCARSACRARKPRAGFMTRRESPRREVLSSAAEATALVVAHRLFDFLAAVHHERTVLDHRFVERPGGQQQEGGAVRAGGEIDALTMT